MRTIHLQRYASPCGELMLGEVDGRLCLCDWVASPRFDPELERLASWLGAVCHRESSELTRLAALQLDEFFRGKRRAFDVPLLTVGTPFREAVWQALKTVPWGTTVDYTTIAEASQHPTAVRAVASAIGSNQLSIFIPCHRIVARDGSVGGYRGGLAAKHNLLSLETNQPSPLSV